jgi:hypothetical protein
MGDLGNKYICFQCGTKFYDLRRPEPLCPKCGANQKNAPPDSGESRQTRADRRAIEDEAEAPEVDLPIDDEDAGVIDDEISGEEEEEETDLEEY